MTVMFSDNVREIGKALEYGRSAVTRGLARAADYLTADDDLVR